MKKKLFAKPISILMAFTFVFTSLFGLATVRALENVPVTGVSLDKETLKLTIGASEKLVVKISPDNATIKDVIWQSDNPLVAQVTNGIVRGFGEGTTIIKATTKDQGKVAYSIVTVSKNTSVTPILNVKADDDNNGIPDYANPAPQFTIEGRVSADFRYSANNTTVGPLYIQDNTAGIGIQNITTTLPLGTKIKVVGTVIYNGGETQFLATSSEIVNTTIESVNPVKLSTKNSMLEQNEGLLVTIEGKITKMIPGEIFVNDSSTPESDARVNLGSNFVLVTTQASITTSASLKVGDMVKVTGIAAQDTTGHKIVLRESKDLTLVTTETKKDKDKEASKVTLNKSKLTLKPGKSEYVTILATPGNLNITSVKIKGTATQFTITTDKKNTRLIRITAKANALKETKKIEIEVIAAGKTYTLPLEVTIDGKTPPKVKEKAKPKVTEQKKGKK